MPTERYAVEIQTPHGLFCASEPSPPEIQQALPELARFYNERHNRSMLGNTMAMAEPEILRYYAEMQDADARPFLLHLDDKLMGDADLRHIQPPFAEFAILIGDRTRQGHGLGLQFSLLIHALAFADLNLERIYASILPENAASLRLFEKLGYTRDLGAQALTYADADTDVILSLDRARFAQLHEISRVQIRQK